MAAAACGFAFLTLLAALFIVRRRGVISRGAAFLTLGVGLFTALLTTVVFLIDVIFVAVAKSDVKQESYGLVYGDYGNAVRLTHAVFRVAADHLPDIIELDGPWRSHCPLGLTRWRMLRSFQTCPQAQVGITRTPITPKR